MIGKQFILIAWDPENTGTQAILIHVETRRRTLRNAFHQLYLSRKVLGLLYTASHARDAKTCKHVQCDLSSHIMPAVQQGPARQIEVREFNRYFFIFYHFSIKLAGKYPQLYGDQTEYVNKIKIIGKQFILIAQDPGNTGKQSILGTCDPGNTGSDPFWEPVILEILDQTHLGNLGSWKYWIILHHTGYC